MANGDKLNGLAGCDFAFHSKFCWEHDCRSGNGLLIVRIDTDAFVLFDEKPDLL